MHHAEVVPQLNPLTRQPPHVGVPKDIATVLVLEHDDQNVIECPDGGVPGTREGYGLTRHLTTHQDFALQIGRDTSVKMATPNPTFRLALRVDQARSDYARHWTESPADYCHNDALSAVRRNFDRLRLWASTTPHLKSTLI